MPKKTVISKTDDSDNDYYEDNESFDNEVMNEEDDEDEDEENNIKDYIEQDTDTHKCLIDEIINDDDEYYENDYNINENSQMRFSLKEERISCNRLTKYEMVRILGERSKQLTMGAKPLVKNYNKLSYEQIAEEELKLNMIPLKIIRPLPNGKFELWTLDELEKEHLYSQLE